MHPSVYKTPNGLSSEKVNGGQIIVLQRGVVTGQHSTLEKAARDKYIDGARPTRDRDVRKSAHNETNTSPTKNPTVRREEQRHDPLLLFSLRRAVAHDRTSNTLLGKGTR